MAGPHTRAWIYELGPIDHWEGWTPLQTGPAQKNKKRWYSELTS
jgi:hypothetical protein